MKAYNPHEIEPRLQLAWEEAGLYTVPENSDAPKKYVLEMFPYPSGDMHMGHASNYTYGDVVARYSKMQGFDVLHPMGWDAFGLPAENAAIKHHSHPAIWTYENIETQKKSFSRMGFSYDWDRKVVACDPEYYRWGQWIFLKFWERGLVERRNSPVNWCPSCGTVLANEQVIEGRCWRCDSEVEKRDLTQWYYKITDYAQELLDDLDQLEGWPERVKQQQANWIGRSEGANVDFILCDRDGNAPENPTEDDIITVFTTRADTLFGCSFFLLAPESKLLHGLVEGTEYEAPVMELVEAAKKVTAVQRAQGDHEKHGAFTGRYVVNPINGEKVPVWVGDYIVADYGTGAVMAVPCGDQRDFEFARKYDLPIIPIILPEDDPLYPQLKDEQGREVTTVDWPEAYAAEGILVQSGPYTGMTRRQALRGRSGHRGRAGRNGPRQAHRGVPPARLAHLPPALLGQPHPRHPLREVRRGARARGRSARAPARGHRSGRRRDAGHPCRVREHHLPGLRRPGQARDRHHGHLHVLQLVLHALHRPAQRARALQSGKD